MCGIAGVLAYQRDAASVDAAELARMSERMRLRGPDGEGQWLCKTGRIGLAHRRLSIIDLSTAAAQPMWSHDRRFAITFNGEIYNYKALRAELIEKGWVFQSDSDTEVLLGAYALFGADMVHRLRGMFAFAIWDTQSSALFLARDPLGIKPLYYADDGVTLRFASQVKALLAGGAVDPEPDPAGWAGFYLLGSVPEPLTTCLAIRALPAGATMKVSLAGGPEPIVAYHSVAQTLRDGARCAPDEKLDGVAISSKIRESVEAHLVADVKVGCFLSGGIDSGALLSLMSELTTEPVASVTLAFSEFAGTPNDEVPLAQEASALFGAEHHVRYVDAAEFEQDLPRIIAAMDQPSIDAVNVWFVSKAAAEQGLKVMISGLGGDEVFGGYSTFADVPRWVRWIRPLAPFPWVGRLIQHALNASNRLRPLGNPKMGSFMALGGTMPGAYLLRRGLFMPDELAGIMGAKAALAGLERLKPLLMIQRAMEPDPGSDFSRICALETSLYMRNQLLRDMDWASMAHSLEVRVPLVDAVLLASLARASTPPDKQLLAKSPARPLPPSISHRSKVGFSTPIAQWRQAAGTPDGVRRATAKRPLSGVNSRDWARTIAQIWPSSS